MNINPLDTPGVPFEIELLNPNPSSSRKGYRVSFQVSEEVHSAFMAAREGNLRLIGKLAVAPDTDEQPAHDAVNGAKPKKEKESKGPHGQLWKHLRLAGFVNCPGVTETIDKFHETHGVEGETRWDDLHKIFGVDSMAAVSPEQIYARFPQNEYPAVKTMVQQALRKAGEK